jgi:hypothetical protein
MGLGRGAALRREPRARPRRQAEKNADKCIRWVEALATVRRILADLEGREHAPRIPERIGGTSGE